MNFSLITRVLLFEILKGKPYHKLSMPASSNGLFEFLQHTAIVNGDLDIQNSCLAHHQESHLNTCLMCKFTSQEASSSIKKTASPIQAFQCITGVQSTKPMSFENHLELAFTYQVSWSKESSGCVFRASISQ